MAQLQPEQVYPSDLTDEQWKLIQPLVAPKTGQGQGPGRPVIVDRRQVVNALLYRLRTGCQWRYLPKDYPNWHSVRYYFDTWTEDGTFQRLNDILREQDRVREGREPQPSGAIIDSQAVKTTEVGGVRGYDGGKKIKGRKRQLTVDTQGHLLRIKVHAADIHDGEGAEIVMAEMAAFLPRLTKMWADSLYDCVVEWFQEELGIELEIVKKLADQAGFVVLPRRWVVERTIAWLCRNRLLSKDYEYHTECSEAWVYLASVHLLAKRLAKAA